MRAIRARSPQARLLQTEDIARTFATTELLGQAAYENDRRWLSLDLLDGRVDRSHPFHAALRHAGVADSLLAELATGEGRPDIIGANHYVTSERFLDHRTALYPPKMRGGNGRQSYADIEAVRVDLPSVLTGWAPRLRELWQRYRISIVLSEVHLGCDDDLEQARWFKEAWDAAVRLRNESADIGAVTAWALAGAVDWDSLMCERRGSYECRAWDFTPNGRRPRLLAQMLPVLASTGRFDHPGLQMPGWWRRQDRFAARKVHDCSDVVNAPHAS